MDVDNRRSEAKADLKLQDIAAEVPEFTDSCMFVSYDMIVGTSEQDGRLCR